MIKDINLLKPDDGIDSVVLEFVENLAKACGGRGGFSATIYSGDSPSVAQSILDHFKPYDRTKKLYSLGGYMWTVEVEYIAIRADVHPLILRNPSKMRHNITVTFFAP